MAKQYEICSEYHLIPERGLNMAIHHPKENTERRKILVLATHGGSYIMSFAPLLELAKLGYTTAGFPMGMNGKTSYKERMLDIKAAMEYVRRYPGVQKVILFGHSQGGCMTSCYQYLAENGTDRFKNTQRIVPFPDLPALPAADGLMLVDANHGIMEFLGYDPAVKDFHNGKERIPELDLYNPDNGYAPGCARYSKEFAARFQTAQVKFYNEVLAYAQQKLEDIRLGRGRFVDDDMIVIAGAAQNHATNKLFIQDNRFIGSTKQPRPLLHPDGSITNEVVHTMRQMRDAFPSETFRGAITRTARELCESELRFDNFGYDESNIWGVDQNFNPYSTRANVRGIHVPLLCEGNQGNHEFVNIDLTYDAAVSTDKEIIMVEGSDHGFEVMTNAEQYPGQFGNPAATFAAYAAEWLAKPGRFMN